MVRVRVGVWNRVSVSKTVALLRVVTLRPAKYPLPLYLDMHISKTQGVVVYADFMVSREKLKLIF